MYTGIIGTASNRADYELIQQAVDDDTGEPVDLTTATITFEISEPGCAPRISATTGNGKITLIENNVFRVFIGKDEMGSLCAGQYDLGATIENAGQTESLIIGSLQVLDGKVSR